MNVISKKYRINEIFYSLQGEGRFAGSAAVFIRFSGCNLKCPFCDTDFHTYKEMTADDIADMVDRLSRTAMIVFTGGEPSLQLDYNLLFRLRGRQISVETNGTNEIDNSIGWITLSPKCQWQKTPLRLKYCDEVKVVMDENTKDEDLLRYMEAYPKTLYYVQPCDTGNEKKNKEIIKKCMDFVMRHTQWQLSLQQQKILNIR